MSPFARDLEREQRREVAYNAGMSRWRSKEPREGRVLPSGPEWMCKGSFES